MTGISYQLYSSREFPPLAETLTMLGGLGYDEVEGYGALYRSLDDLGAVRAGLDSAGLRMASGHFALDMVEGEPDKVLEIARALGIGTVIVPFLLPEQRPADAAGWSVFGKRLAEAGKPIRDAGLVFGWHNHAFEVEDIGGSERPLDLILGASDDTALELDLAWVQRGGEDPMTWLEKYADRLVAAHVKDIAPKGQNLDEDGWADVGQGVMDWEGLMAALRQTGCRHFVMEHDKPNDHARFARRSIEFVKSL